MHHLTGGHKVEVKYSVTMNRLNRATRYVEASQNTDFRLPGHISCIISEIVHWPENISLLFGAGE